MADQTSIGGNRTSSWTSSDRDRGPAYSSSGPIQGVKQGASSVLGDAFDLAELQSRLFVADAKEFTGEARVAVLGLVLALACLIASLPVVALGLAQWLAWAVEWPLWVTQLVVGGLLVLSGIGTAAWCVKRLRSSFKAFQSTQREAIENIRWLRQAFSKTLTH